jgi:site-specific recombinase XerC
MVTMHTGDLLARYVMWMRAAGRSPVTIDTRRRQAAHLIDHCDPITATTGDLVAFLARPDWRPATRASERAAVRCFCRWLVDAGLRDDDPSARLPAVRVPPGVPHPAGEDALARARRLAVGPYERAMVELAARAGLRRAEIAGLTFADLLTDPGGGYALRVRGKGGRTRMVPIPLDLAHRLLDLRRDHVFPGRHPGEHVSPTWVGAVLSRLLGPGASAHSLRHRYATRIYDSTHDLLAVQQLLGHSSPTTTQVYVRRTMDDLRSAARAAS